MERCDFTQGRYKLHYDVDRYFEAKKQDTLYPFIEVNIFLVQFTQKCWLTLNTHVLYRLNFEMEKREFEMKKTVK